MNCFFTDIEAMDYQSEKPLVAAASFFTLNKRVQGEAKLDFRNRLIGPNE